MSTLHLSTAFPANEQRVIRRALRLLEKYQRQPGKQFTATSFAKSWVQLQLAREEREVFLVMYLDNQHCLLEHEALFTGSISHTEVHPRELVKAALRHNAAAVILAHNHPSGTAEISQQDKHVTQRIVKALALVEVRVLDHLVVGNEVVSFAEQGLL
ncbi:MULTISPECIES: RadC family protein [Yersinia]|uniref:RadC family protein n=1 Tax=Yersinia TaxID=629 RepID=UPI000B6E2398|nr:MULTISPECIES: DNA repair protein RadC [Yersinia]MBW5813354.1 DNA repair protein RadC [Yersinia kristensenii]MBW5830639.1 DNA repair protein RadC [Yersinia kristensenii]MBW5867553.1 DNA repair protein RadC [Yersinia enterocolitica]MCB5298083.1 DNA repair protein RadC [Yersinia intermedia]MCW8111087.1 DNA repair protein RadC [Yersinia intermedia]